MKPDSAASPVAPWWTVEYLGTFLVVGSSQQSRVDYVRAQLEQIKDGQVTSQRVRLTVSLDGIRVLAADGKKELMAHALKRVSYATCDPERAQFAYLSREPRESCSRQYCHVFGTELSDQADEISQIVGGAFRAAYIRKLQHQPISEDRYCVNKPEAELSPFQLQQHNDPEPLILHESDSSSGPEISTSTASSSSSSFGSQRVISRGGAFDAASSASNASSPDLCQASAQQTPNKPTPLPRKRPPSAPDIRRRRVSLPANQVSRSLNNVNYADRSRNGSRVVTPHVKSSIQYYGAERQEPAPVSPSLNNQQNSRTRIRLGVSAQQRPSSMLVLPPEHVIESGRSPQKVANIISPNGCVMLGDEKISDERVQLLVTNSVTGGRGPLAAPPSIPPPALPSSSNDASHTSCNRKRSIFRWLMGKERNREVPDLSQSSGDLYGFMPTHQNLPVDYGTNTPQRRVRWESTGQLRKDKRQKESSSSSLRSVNISAGKKSGGNLRNRFSGQDNYAKPLSHNVAETNFMRGAVRLSGTDLDTELKALENAPWFCGCMPRDVVTRVLRQEFEGTFVIRRSVSQPGCFALSVKVPAIYNSSGVSHFLILNTPQGYKLKGFTKEHASIESLVVHHSILKEQLPCRLLMSRFSPADSGQFSSSVDGSSCGQDDGGPRMKLVLSDCSKCSLSSGCSHVEEPIYGEI